MIHPHNFLSLPVIDKFPKVQGSGRAVALIPIFRDAYVSDDKLACLVKAALYARLSCLCNTDAVAHGVAVKFYIEESLRVEITETLEANGVDVVQDVIWFEARKIDAQTHAYLSKKTCMFTDVRFKLAEWVFLFDCDFFFCPMKYGLFDMLLRHPTIFGAVRKRPLHDDWKATLARQTDLGGIPLEDILKATDLDPLPRGREAIEVPVGYFYAFPAQYFHAAYPDWLQWMRRCALYIGDDEHVLALSSAKFGFHVWEMESEIEFSVGELRHVDIGEFHAVRGNLSSDQDLVELLDVSEWVT